MKATETELKLDSRLIFALILRCFDCLIEVIVLLLNCAFKK